MTARPPRGESREIEYLCNLFNSLLSPELSRNNKGTASRVEDLWFKSPLTRLEVCRGPYATSPCASRLYPPPRDTPPGPGPPPAPRP
jgi:hypothetical protein